MSIYLIVTPWLANGNISVFVEAYSETAALNRAEAALMAEADRKLARFGKHAPQWAVDHHAEEIETYKTREGWRIKLVELPLVIETS